MNTNLIAAFHECGAGSVAGRVDFPSVVGKLIEVGAEGYHFDLYRREKTYYMPDGSSHVEALALDPAEFNGGHVGRTFDQDGITAALRAVQGAAISYVEFLRRIMVAGCLGYQVCITGRRALYFGRAGQVHVELFPGAR